MKAATMRTPYLTSLDKRTVLVPSLWSVELANAIMVGERAKRLAQAEVKEFLTLLQSLAIRLDVQPIWYYIDGSLPLARAYGLTAYEFVLPGTCHPTRVATCDAGQEVGEGGQTGGREAFRVGAT